MRLDADDYSIFGTVKDMDEFQSPFPSNTSPTQMAKFIALAEEVNPGWGAAAQAAAWKDAIQIGMRAVTTSRVGGGIPRQWFNQLIIESDRFGVGGQMLYNGLFAAVSFIPSNDSDDLLGDMRQNAFNRGVDFLAANTGVWGTVMKACVKLGEFLFGLSRQDETVRLKTVPWQEYSKGADEDLIRHLLAPMLHTSVDWTPLFAPPMSIDLEFQPGEPDKDFQARSWGVFSADGDPMYTGGFGFMPDTSRIAEVVQVAGSARIGAQRRDIVTNVGDYTPSVSQFAMAAEQFINRVGSADMYKIRPGDLEVAWTEYFENFFDDGIGWISAMRRKGSSEDNRVTGLFTAKALARFVAIYSRPTQGSPWYLSTIGAPEPWLSTNGNIDSVFDRSDVLQRLLSEEGLINPFRTPHHHGTPNTMWKSVHTGVILPALRRLKERQKRSLAHSLACAYVRWRELPGLPEGPSRLPAFAAFLDEGPPLDPSYRNWGEELREYCKQMRELFLTHADRYKVRTDDVEIIDPPFARLLADSKGVAPPLGVAAGFRPLDPEAEPPPEPEDPKGGVPFGLTSARPPKKPKLGTTTRIFLGAAAAGGSYYGYRKLRQRGVIGKAS